MLPASQKTDTADIGRLLLRLRDKIESTRQALESDDVEESRKIIEGCSSFLLSESEKIVALQDGALGSSESFAQLPPVRLVDTESLDLSHRVNSILKRAETASGMDLNIEQLDGPLSIMDKPSAPPPSTSAVPTAANDSMIQNSIKQTQEFIGDRRGHNHGTKIMKGLPNVQNLPVRPKDYNQNTTENPDVYPRDVDRGLINLLDRGIVPHAANIEIVPSPIFHDKSQLHDSRQHIEALKDRTHAQEILNKEDPQFKLDSKESASQSKQLAIREFDTPIQPLPLPPPGTPAAKTSRGVSRLSDLHNNPFDHYGAMIETGRARYNTLVCQEHLGEETWIVAKDDVLAPLEVISADYAIPIMLITQKSLRKIAEWSQLCHPRKLTKIELLNCLENKNEVRQLMTLPGRLYTGPRREHLASLKITAMFKGRKDRQAFLLYRRRQQAAGIIAISWIMHVRLRNCRNALMERRKLQLINYHKQIKKLKSDWPLKGPKIIIHLPSLGYPRKIRFTAQDLERRQMSQIMRLVDSMEPDTHVVYISSLPFTDDLHRYYTRLLGIRPALKSGSPNTIEQETNVSSRFTVIVPEAVSKFPTHCMSLAQHLKYSSKAMNRLKNMVKGKQALLIPGIVCLDTLAIADELEVPVYGSEPEVCHLYSTKSGSRRIFNAAGIDLPPGDYDIYNIQQLVESLAGLITNNPFVEKWIIKLDCQFDGRGSFVFNAEHIPCISQVQKECRRCGPQWAYKSFQQVSFVRILEQLPNALKTTKPANSLAHSAYNSWDIFQKELCRQGGVIEALPPTNEITNITVDIEITPHGDINLITCGDQIHSENFYCWGWSVPQTSIEPDILRNVSIKIGNAARERNIIGFVKLTFLTFMGENTEQHLWATGMKVQYSDLVGLTKLLEFSSSAKMNAAYGEFMVDIEQIERITRETSLSGAQPGAASITKRETMKKKVMRKQERFAVMSTQLLHTNLAVLHYTVFFQMCRAHAIGWDVRNKVGTLFTLLDTVKRENVGMICCGTSLPDTIQNFARGLSVIHQEISAPNMQGITNFHSVLCDIDKVVELIGENEETDCNEGRHTLSDRKSVV